MTLGLLLWNRSRPRPTPDFSDRVVDCFQRGCFHCYSLMSIPTFNRTRHFFTREGMVFRHAMRQRQQGHRREFTRFQFEIHELLEEVKANNAIETHETTRLSDLVRSMHIYVEQLQMIKEYRTTNIARSFVRVYLLLCPAMYGAYFSFVSGNIVDGAATGSLPYAICLCVASIILIVVMVNLERAMEDPFTTNFRGDSIDVAAELQDTNERLELIRQYCSEEGKQLIHQHSIRRNG